MFLQSIQKMVLVVFLELKTFVAFKIQRQRCDNHIPQINLHLLFFSVAVYKNKFIAMER